MINILLNKIQGRIMYNLCHQCLHSIHGLNTKAAAKERFNIKIEADTNRKYLLRLKAHLTLGLCQLALQILVLALPGLQVILVRKPLLVSLILEGSDGSISGSNRMLVATLDTFQFSLVGPGHL